MRLVLGTFVVVSLAAAATECNPSQLEPAPERLQVTVDPRSQGALRSLAPGDDIALAFSKPVAPTDVASHCAFAGAKARVPARVDAPNVAPAASRLVALQPAAPLDKATTYDLTCDANLAPVGGGPGLGQIFVAVVKTYGGLVVTSASPRGDETDYDKQTIEIDFSNPVTAADVAKRLTASPEIDGLDKGAISTADPRIYQVSVKLAPDTAYSLDLASGVEDVFGQSLTEEYDWSFTTGGDEADVATQAGTFTVPSSAPRYPVYTRNVDHLDVSAARVPESKLVAVLAHAPGADSASAQEEADWQEEGGQGGDGGGSGAFARTLASLGLDVHLRSIDTSGHPGAWHDASVDAAALTDGGAKTGMFALAIGAQGASQPEKAVLENVTDLGLVADVGPASGLVWVVSLSTGQPVAGATVDIWDRSGKKRFTGTTDDDGTVATPGIEALGGSTGTAGGAGQAAAQPDDGEGDDENGGSSNTQPALDGVVVARTNNDLAVLAGSWTEGMTAFAQATPAGAAPADGLRGFIETDRGLYRPGDTVHLKGLVRAVHLADGMVVPPATQATVEVKDARGDVALDKAVTLTPFGGFDLDVPLPEEAHLGSWQITASVGASEKGAKPAADAPASGGQPSFSQSFLVDDYRAATFQVTASPKSAQVQAGQTMEVDLDARYLFGTPVANGKVVYKVLRRNHAPAFDAYPGFVFADLAPTESEAFAAPAPAADDTFSLVTAGSTATLDGDGHAALTISTDGDPDQPQDYEVEATISDRSNEAVTAQAVFAAQASALHLGLSPSVRMPDVGAPFTVDALALGGDGKPRVAQAELQATLRTWSCPDSGNAGNAGVNTDAADASACQSVDTDVFDQSIDLSKAGATSIPLNIAQAGTLTVRLSGTDDQGSAVAASDLVWVVGPGETFAPSSTGDDSVVLHASRDHYKPGDDAELLPESPLEGTTALLTIERDGVLDHMVVHPTDGAPLSLPIRDAYAPNVFAHVTVLRPSGGAPLGKLATGVVDLTVDPSQRALTVAVTTDKASYRPGDPVTATIHVTDENGNPVSAEVALAAADEGVLELDGGTTPDPFPAFYAPFALSVAEATAWTHFAPALDPNESQLRTPVYPEASAAEEWEEDEDAPEDMEMAEGEGEGGGGGEPVPMAAPVAVAPRPMKEPVHMRGAIGGQMGGVVGGVANGTVSANSLTALADQSRSDTVVAATGEAPAPTPRHNFLPTAYWNPSLRTGPDGSTTVTFNAPDNLTSFRLMASAADSGQRFGAGQAELDVKKPLSLLAAVPRYLDVGDHASLGVVVENDTAQSGPVTIAFDPPSAGAGLALDAGASSTATVTVQANSSQVVRFPVVATAVPDSDDGTTKLTFHATLGDERDDLALSMPVQVPVDESVTPIGEGSAGGPTVLTIIVPPHVKGGGGLEVTTDGCGLSGIDQGLAYLVQYPYG
jgi:uncharacterized protein YfaS (alpha-2-macroglobulin family)